jgi:hypothetical protein
MTLTVDKRADLVISEKSLYHKKLEIALHSNFQKIENYTGNIDNMMEKNLEEFRYLLKNTFIGSLPNCKIRGLYPSSTILKIYGTLKLHKTGESLVQNAEKFLKKCEFSIRNQKNFKGKFLSDSGLNLILKYIVQLL